MMEDLRQTDREEMVERARSGEYDLAIVGGGIAGAGVARDAALRGLDTILVEQTDFGAGTTAWSTRLVHGGLRYLEQYDFSLVFESLQERETLAEIAPHLVDPLEFVIPQYDESLFERLKVGLGMLLYDALSYNKTMPTHDRLSRSALAEKEPTLPEDGLQSGFVYHDRQVDFVERLCLETVLDAAAHGADVLNHARATAVRSTDGDVTGVEITDELADETIEIESKTVLNATGPWANDFLDDLTQERVVRPTKGIHLVVEPLTEHALTLPTSDGRVVFVVPWDGKSLVGTTDTDFEEDPANARATASDVEYLLEEAGRYFPELSEDDIHYAYAGVRPLYDSDPDADASAVSRRHEVIEHGDGLFSLVGAKITPYRSAAEDATDTIADHLTVDAACETADLPLPGGFGYLEPSIETDVDQSTIDHLRDLYGSRTENVLARIDSEERLAEPLCDHTEDVLAQVVVAIEEEYARSLTDVMLRRCTVGHETCQGSDAVETVAEEMADRLDWTDRRTKREIERYESVIDRRTAFRDNS